jgi:hypothetical protein
VICQLCIYNNMCSVFCTDTFVQADKRSSDECVSCHFYLNVVTAGRIDTPVVVSTNYWFVLVTICDDT